MSTPEPDHAEKSSKTQKELRYEHPTDWLSLIEKQLRGLHLIIDTLLSATNRELVEADGVSRHTVRAHLDTLLEHGIVESVADGKRYRFNLDSLVTQEICELNGAINAVGAGHMRIERDTGRVVDERDR